MQNPVWAFIFPSRNEKQSLEDLLSSLPIFDGLSRGQLKLIMRILHERKYLKDETVFNETEPGAGLYIIESGRVVISKQVKGADPIALAEFVKGNFFGELALIEEIPRSATATAWEATTLLAFPKPDLDHLIDRQPQLAVKILYNLSRLVAQRLIQTNENIGRLRETDVSDS